MFFTMETSSDRIVGTSDNGDLSLFPEGLRKDYYFKDVNKILEGCCSEDEKISKVFSMTWASYEGYFENDDIYSIEIIWGDWKHDHIFCDHLMGALGYSLIEETVTEEDGSDCYSSVHRYRK